MDTKPNETVQHGGARQGAGRKPTAANQKIRVNRIQDRLREQFETGFLKVAEKFPDLLEMMLDGALRTENRKVECAMCKHVTEIVVPMPDKDMQKWLAGKVFQAQDIDDETDLSALKRIVQETKDANGTKELPERQGEADRSEEAGQAKESA